MKKVFIALGVAALLAGCASHNENATGGTSDTYNSSTSSGVNNSGVANNASDKAESNTTLTNNNNSGTQP